MRIEYLSDEVDPIAPVSIRHCVDEMRDDGRLRERYAYLVYLFERDGLQIVARAYLDEVGRVLLFDLAPADEPGAVTRAPAFEAAVMTYLQRRFRVVAKLFPDVGYRDVWRREPTQ